MNQIIILSSAMHREELGLPFAIAEDFARTHQVVAVLTGGTEGLFKEHAERGEIDLSRPVYLMASGHSNSLAASLEILCWVRQQGGTGRVLTEPMPRLGVIGKPSDWLIASGVDYAAVEERFGMQLIDIPIERVSSLGEVDGGIEGAEAICGRLKEIVDEYGLSGLTLRCFDLLTTVKNTGCIALSHLNDEGIPASCEGDIPMLITMMMAQRITGEPGFQINPAEIHPDGRMLWAHCTLPLRMTSSHVLTTHFESGIGVGIHGELPTGEYTLLKIGPDLETVLAENVVLTANQFADNLCRTQVWLKGSPALTDQMLTRPIANHHLLIRGWHAEKFR